MTAIEKLRRRMAAAWQPRDAMRPSEWSRCVTLTEQFEAARGQFDLVERPWWTEVLDCLSDPTVRTVTLRASPQVGKTLSAVVMTLYLAARQPAAGLCVLPDMTSTTEFRDRLYALAKEIPELQGTVPPQWRWNMRHMDLGGARYYLAWSGSRQALRSRRCRTVLLSEVDAYDDRVSTGSPLEAARQRVKAFHRSLIVAESSPRPDPSPIDAMYQGSDRRHWWCPCPICGRWQVPFFEPDDEGRGGWRGYRGADGRVIDPEVARREAYYECLAGCRLTDQHKRSFVVRGRWLPRGQWIDATGVVQGVADRSGADRGYWLWALHSRSSFGEIAAEYCRAERQGTMSDWWQNWYGRAFRHRGGMPEWA